MTLKVGDFVLIYDVDTDSQCDVAKICYMYEDKDPGPMDPCRALVKWYTHPKVFDKYLKNKSFTFHETQEMIENSMFDNDISIETIAHTCNLKILRVDDDRIGSYKTKTSRNFFCRYKLVRKPGTNKYLLEPIPEPGQMVLQVILLFDVF